MISKIPDNSINLSMPILGDPVIATLVFHGTGENVEYVVL